MISPSSPPAILVSAPTPIASTGPSRSGKRLSYRNPSDHNFSRPYQADSVSSFSGFVSCSLHSSSPKNTSPLRKRVSSCSLASGPARDNSCRCGQSLFSVFDANAAIVGTIAEPLLRDKIGLNETKGDVDGWAVNIREIIPDLEREITDLLDGIRTYVDYVARAKTR